MSTAATAKAAASVQYGILNKEDGAARDSNQNRLSRGPSDGVHFNCFRLYAGGGDREYGEINAGFVHRFQPQLIEVGETALNVGEQCVAA